MPGKIAYLPEAHRASPLNVQRIPVDIPQSSLFLRNPARPTMVQVNDPCSKSTWNSAEARSL